MYLTISTRWGLTSLSTSNESNFCLGSFCAKCTFGFWFCLSIVQKVNSIPLSTANKICLLQRWKILRGNIKGTINPDFFCFKCKGGWFLFFFKTLTEFKSQSPKTHNISTHKGHDTIRFFSTERAYLFSGTLHWRYPLFCWVHGKWEWWLIIGTP